MGTCDSRRSQPKLIESTPTPISIDKIAKPSPKKVLLLGAGSGGKSTLFRQLKCIYKNGFGENEFEETVPIIRRNCVAGILLVLKKSEQLYEMDTINNHDCYIDISMLVFVNEAHFALCILF